MFPFFVFVFVIYFEREIESNWRRVRERETESQAGSTLSVQNAGLELTNRKIMTWAEVRSQTLDRLSHPRAPCSFFSFLFFSLLFFFFFFFFLERERAHSQEGQRERENFKQAPSWAWSPDSGLSPTTLILSPELKSRVGRLTNWAIQAPLKCLICSKHSALYPSLHLIPLIVHKIDNIINPNVQWRKQV